jgi:hypothetical protein
MLHLKRIVDKNSLKGNIYDELDIVSFCRNFIVGDNIFLQRRGHRYEQAPLPQLLDPRTEA